jgi:hypothetical protein
MENDEADMLRSAIFIKRKIDDYFSSGIIYRRSSINYQLIADVGGGVVWIIRKRER